MDDNTYQQTENYDVLVGLGLSPQVSEGLDRLLQDGFVDELSTSLIERFTTLDETKSLECIAKMKSLGEKGIPQDVIDRIMDETTGVEVAEPESNSHAEEIIVNEINECKPEPEMPSSNAVKTESEAATEADPTKSENVTMKSESSVSGDIGNFSFDNPNPQRLGPDPEKLKEILERTGYSHEVVPGLRKYGGPPPGMSAEKPGIGTEVFVGRIPRDVFEDQIIPLFGSIGKLWEVRILTNKSDQNKGYGFVTYCDRKDAKQACEVLGKVQVRPRHKLVVTLSVQFNRLHVKGIPRDKTADEIKEAFSAVVDGLLSVDLPKKNDKNEDKLNRGFCFLEFDSYFEASQAKKKLHDRNTTIPAWDNLKTYTVEWAIPIENPDQEAAEQSTSILISLQDGAKMTKEAFSDEELKEHFGKYGEIESIKRPAPNVKIEFKERESAVKAIEGENEKELKGQKMHVKIFVPMPEYSQRKKNIFKKNANRRLRGGVKRGSGVVKVDARQILTRKANMASRIGSAPAPSPTADVRSQMKNQRVVRMRPIPIGRTPPLPTHRGHMRRIPPPPQMASPMMELQHEREQRLMSEFMMLRKRERELAQSLQMMGSSSAKRMYMGPSTYSDESLQDRDRSFYAGSRPHMPLGGMSRPQSSPRSSILGRYEQGGSFYEDDPLPTPERSRSSLYSEVPRPYEMQLPPRGTKPTMPPGSLKRTVAQSRQAPQLSNSIPPFAAAERMVSMLPTNADVASRNNRGRGVPLAPMVRRNLPQPIRGRPHLSQIPPPAARNNFDGGASFTRF